MEARMKILTIDLGGTITKYGLFTDGVLPASYERPTDAKKGAKHIIDLICEITAQFEDVSCLGISTCGYVDPWDKKIVFSTDAVPGYTGVPIGKILEQKTGLPVAVENDAKCAAIGEMQEGKGMKYNNFLFLSYGTGIGGAIAVNGAIHHGSHGLAGALGHMTIHADGLECTCGRRGCYEMYASTNALLSSIRDRTGVAMNGREAFAHSGDKRIRREIDLWIDEVTAGLISLANIFDPSAFILGGGVMEQESLIREIGKRLNGQTIGGFTDIAVCQAKLGNTAGLYGAYYNAMALLTEKQP